jgi:hypothetical protein
MASSFFGELSGAPQNAAHVQIYSKISGPPRLNRWFSIKDHNRHLSVAEGLGVSESGIPAAEGVAQPDRSQFAIDRRDSSA